MTTRMMWLAGIGVAAASALATVMVITSANAVHALLNLIVSLLAVALVFYVLGAPLVAALEEQEKGLDAQLREQLMMHIHLENNVLFPRALDLNH